MIERDCALAAYEQRPLHIMHLSARESVAAVRAAQARGVAVSAEVSPHHLCLTDDTVRTLDTNRKMNPPLRSEDDRQALLEGLRDGTIACIATDHAPHARHEKDAPFEEAPFGVTGLETAFAALYTYLVEPGELELGLVLERMSAGPARIFGLPVPRIEVGERGEPRPARPRRDLARDRGRLPRRSRSNSWLLGETLTRRRRQDDRRRKGGARGMSSGFLALEDGTVFPARSVGAPGVAFGEAVFTTAMTGYQETVTDPSFAGQLVAFTAPMIGNYGVDDARLESTQPWVKAVLMRRCGGDCVGAVARRRKGIVALEDLDTRKLVLRIRDAGAMRAAAVADEADLDPDDGARADPASSRRWRARRSSRPSRRSSRPSTTRTGACAWRSSTTAPRRRSCAGCGRRAPR